MKKVVGVVFSLMVALTACEDFASPTGAPPPGGGGGNGDSDASFSLHKIAGDGQKGITGETLLEPVEVVVTDQNGNTVEGARVRWRITSQNGGSVPNTSTTGADGGTSAQWRLGNQPGTADRLIAFVDSAGAETQTVEFTATVTGPPDTIVVTQGAVELDNDFNEPELLVGDTVFAATGGWARRPFKAIVLDAAGDSVRGARLTWTATSGGGSVGDEPEGGSETVNVVTDAGGGITVWRKAPTLGQLETLAPGCVDEDDDGNLFLRTDVQCWIGATLSIEDYPEVTPITLDALLRN